MRSIRFALLAILILSIPAFASAAAVTSLGSTYSTTAGAKTVVATPAANDLIVVIVQLSGVNTTPTLTDNNSDGLGTYTKIGSTFATNGTVKCVMGFIRDALVGSASSTTWTMTPSGDNGGGLQVLKVTSMTRTGASAALQSTGQNNQAGAGTPAPVFGSAVNTANPVITGLVNTTNPAGITPRSSPAYTEQVDTGWANPVSGVENSSIDSGETATTITFGGTSASTFSDYAVEIDTSAAPTTTGPGWWGNVW
jgi:hypothetical protein